jgi:hypothetical protein
METSGAVSPAGRPHPGEIVFEDEVEGRRWTEAAADVPLSLAWVNVNGDWRPVVRIVSTGTVEQRHITKIGEDGAMLEVTMQAPPPPPPEEPEGPILPRPDIRLPDGNSG